jgi:MOSC domain-containing protein YiiM
VRPVDPVTSGDRMHVTVAASIASILEVEAAAVPVPGEQHPEPWRVWSDWLARQGLGLVPIARPHVFRWAGPWLALLRAAEGAGQIGVVAFGSPPGLAWHPFGGPEGFDAVQAGYVVAPADVGLWAPSSSLVTGGAGTVQAIAIAQHAEAPVALVQRAMARAGRGLEGDRYFEQRGTFSNRHGRGHDLTLIEGEVLDALTLPPGGLSPQEARRNIVTRGIELNGLVGKTFNIGEVECIGQRWCEPCAHLERLTRKPGTLRGLIHQGGLRADILTDGEIRVGSEITAQRSEHGT